MSEEEKEELQELINLLYNGHISQYGKRKLEEYINKLQKENEELHSEINQRIKLKLENEKIGDELYRKIDKLQKENQQLKEEKLDQICKGVEEEVFEEMREEVRTLREENQRIKDINVELNTDVSAWKTTAKELEEENKKLNLENQALFESINCNDDNMLCRRYEKMKKIIDLMATELSRRPLMIYLDNERDDRLVILDNPKEIIKYYTKKAKE